MPKSKDDFTKAQLRALHARLKNAPTKEERASIFKEADVLPQAVGQWFRRLELAPLGTPGGASKKPTSAKKKPGRPKGSKNASSATKSEPRAVTASASSPGRGTGISIEAKEELIRLLAKFLD